MKDKADHEGNGEARPESPGTPRLPELGPLRVLGEFALTAEIGRGGMGTVYRAIQRSLKRTVAVKVLSPQVSASPKAVMRFQREAVAAAKLHHLHIVPIFALGESDGLYYYAMEFIDGPSLATVIAEARAETKAKDVWPDPDETVVLPGAPEVRNTVFPESAPGRVGTADAVQDGSMVAPEAERTGAGMGEWRYLYIAEHVASIADALDYAHRQGVVHRDIKPHNLLFGGDGRMRISDFGLARLSEQPGVTLTGELIGSPLYMSPEQITGEPSAVDHRTDIYSLGATMYEWLALRPPYPGDTREQVISRILTGEAPSLRMVYPAVPVDLETICMKAIERNPHRRYSTAGQLRDDLRRFIQRRPIRARRAGVGTRCVRFVRRHRVWSLATSATIVALLLVGTLIRKERQVRTHEAVAQQAIEDREKLRQDATDVLSLLPFELRELYRLGEAAVPVVQDVVGAGQRTMASASEADTANPATVSSVSGIARRAVRELHDWSALQGLWDQASDPSDVVAGPSDSGGPPLLFRAVERIRANPDDMIELEVAGELVEEHLQRHDDDFAAQMLHVVLEGRLGRFDVMREGAEKLVRVRPDHPLGYLWLSLAAMLVGDGSMALEALDQSGEDATTNSWRCALRGLALLRLERTQEAVEWLSQALERDPPPRVALLGRSTARAALRDLSGAVADLTRLLEREPNNAAAYVRRGDLLVLLEDYAAAARDYDAAIALAGRTPALSVRHLWTQTRQGEPPSEQAPRANPTGGAEIESPEDNPQRRASGRSLIELLMDFLLPRPQERSHANWYSLALRLFVAGCIVTR